MSFDVAGYWNERYRKGWSSGVGSEGNNARIKAGIVNRWIAENAIKSVVDWGCGDGTTLSHLEGFDHYTGVDVSEVILRTNAAKFPGLSFVRLDPRNYLRADMALSMDVLFHQIEDDEFHRHLDQLFSSARKAVVIGSTDDDRGRTAKHVMRRAFTPVVAYRFPQWRLHKQVEGPTDSGLYLYLRK